MAPKRKKPHPDSASPSPSLSASASAGTDDINEKSKGGVPKRRRQKESAVAGGDSQREPAQRPLFRRTTTIIYPDDDPTGGPDAAIDRKDQHTAREPVEKLNRDDGSTSRITSTLRTAVRDLAQLQERFETASRSQRKKIEDSRLSVNEDSRLGVEEDDGLGKARSEPKPESLKKGQKRDGVGSMLSPKDKGDQEPDKNTGEQERDNSGSGRKRKRNGDDSGGDDRHDPP